MSEKIMPRPVLKDRNGKPVKYYTPREWFLKLQEEIYEAMDAYNYDENKFDEEIADVITVCVSWLETLGVDEEMRSELFRKVNLKNEKRGYFEEDN